MLANLLKLKTSAVLRWLTLLVCSAVPVQGAVDEEPSKAGAEGRSGAAMSRIDSADAATEGISILRDLRELSDAVAIEQTSTAPSEVHLEGLLRRLGRPARTVSIPTLTSAELDRLIAESTVAGSEALVSKTSDEEFLRRVRLDLTGKLPTPEEVLEFAADADPRKRVRLIDALLASDDFARNWARYWRDVISYHATTENPRLVNFKEFEDWMAEQWKANRPWDEIVRGMLTATGSTDENGATALLIAHTNNQRFQPAEMAGEAARIFLGIQLACAQCHDHKTDPWKREQFHELAAFFAGTQVRRNGPPPVIDRTVSNQSGVPRYGMPDLENPQRSIPVQPRFFLARDEKPLPRLSAEARKALAASYITGQDNPWFAKAFINRVWYALLGEAFYLPVDDMGPNREAVAPAVLDRLAAEWAAGGYDIHWLFRTILNTDLYQRRGSAPVLEADRSIAEICPSRLRADAILDSLVLALGLPLDGLSGRVGRNPRTQQGAQVPAAVRGRFDARVIFNAIFGVDPSLTNDEVLGTIPQALFFMNSPQIHRGVTATPGTVLGKVLAEHGDDDAALEALYLRVLARRPNDSERAQCRTYITQVGNRREAFEDILWALVNSTEFVTRR